MPRRSRPDAGALHRHRLPGTGDLAVSAYDMDESDDSIALAVLHFEDGSHVATLSEAEARRQFAAVQHYVEESLNGSFQVGREESTERVPARRTLRRRGRSVTRYRLYLLTNKALSARAKDFPSSTSMGFPSSTMSGTSSGSGACTSRRSVARNSRST